MATRTLPRLIRPTVLRATVLGLAQILIWGGSFFLMAVLAPAVIHDTGWASAWVYGSLSVSIFISGVLAPVVGRWIGRYGGSRLLEISGFIVGLGLLILSIAPSLAIFFLGWCVIGIGMAAGLYDALFATLGQHYGPEAKGIIVQVTLIAGFCTTVTWPLLSALTHAYGWRGTCLIYGLVLWGVIWPLNTLGLPTVPTDGPRPVSERRVGVNYLREPLAILIMMLALALWAACLGLLIGSGGSSSSRGKGVYTMSEVSTFRLYLLRAMYVFMFVGLAIFKLPGILNPPPGISNPVTVVGSVLAAIGLLAALGIRYPLKMLP